MAQVQNAEGNVIEAFCPKCESNTEQTILKMAKRVIRELRCETCGSIHEHQKPGGKSRRPAGGARAARKRQAEEDSATQARAEWEKLTADHSGTQSRRYSMSADWNVGDVLDHETFGKGVVIRRTGERKVEVAFQVGRKKLVINTSG